MRDPRHGSPGVVMLGAKSALRALMLGLERVRLFAMLI
jgi:hypothetical protein